MWGKKFKKEKLRKPKDPGLETFIESLKVRKKCNNFDLSDFHLFIDFDACKWKSEDAKLSVRWHPACYSTFCNSENLKYLQKETLPSDQSGSTSSITGTRSSKKSFNIRKQCLFCCQTKYHGDTKLIKIEYQHVIDEIKRTCNELKDIELVERIGIDFNNLPAYDASYHSYCKQNYLTKGTTDPHVTVHDKCFAELVKYIEPLLKEDRALLLPNLLDRYKSLLKEDEYENFDSYTIQSLKQKIINHYQDDVCIEYSSTARSQYVYHSSVSVADVINIAAEFKKKQSDLKMINETAERSKDKTLKLAASLLSDDIKKVDGIQIHPLDPDSISSHVIAKIVPSSLKVFLTELCGKPKKTHTKERFWL